MKEFTSYEGKVLDGRYRIESCLGHGGSATVYKAQDTLMDRTVAVKILQDDADELRLNSRSFETEAQATTMLSHPNVVNVWDISMAGEDKYIVMEYVDGISLRAYIDHRGVLPLTEAISCTRQILRALMEAHSKGIIHRDIKPQNVMVMKNGQIKVTDFGIAKLPGVDRFRLADRSIGSVHYLSPEQASGGEIDSRSDIYSVGILLYELCTGRVPFHSENVGAIPLMHVTDMPAAPSNYNPDIPVGLEQIILKALAKDPADRYQSAEAMLRAVEKVSENHTYVFRDTEDESGVLVSVATGTTLRRQKLRKAILPAAISFASLALLMGTVVLLGILLHGRGISVSGVRVHTVPCYVDTVYDAAMPLAEGMHVAAIQYVYDAAAPGMILEQSPAAGEHYKDTTGITLTVSLGPRTAQVGSMVGDYRVVLQQLEQAYGDIGFTTELAYAYSPTVPAGNVISALSSTAGNILQQGSVLTLTVSLGTEEKVCAMPDVVGMNVLRALQLLEESDLPYQISYTDGEAGTEQTVLTQSIAPGTEVPCGATASTVLLTVARGSIAD